MRIFFPILSATLADDVLDSMGPRDLDHDGVAEDRGPLGVSEENVECFLPDDEREKRRKSARHVKWAINVGTHTRHKQPGLITSRSMSLSISFSWPPRGSLPFTPARSP